MSFSLRTFAFILLFFSNQSQSQSFYPLAYGDSSVLPGASFACLDAFNANVSCGSAIGILLGDPFTSFSQSVLESLCGGGCFNSLQTYRETIDNQCGPDVTWENVADSSVWPATYVADKALYGLDMACLRRGDGNGFCNQWFQSGVNTTATPECDTCYLETARLQADSSVANDPAEMQIIYSSLSASCSYDGAPATRTVPPLLIASPTATAECAAQYNAQAGESIFSISRSQRVRTHDLLTANGLPSNLTSLSSSMALCIRSQCDVYVVQEGDTCRGICSEQRLAFAELLAWNPAINGLCDNLGGMVEETICVTNPLGDFAVPNNTQEAGSPAPVPENLAPETATHCAQYHNVVGDDSCGTLGVRYGIPFKDFRFLNPMIFENCTNLWLDYSYCVTPVGPIDEYQGYNPPTSTFTFTPEDSTPIPWVDVLTDSPDALTIPLANATRVDCWDYLWWNASRGEPMSCEDVAFQYEISMEQLLTWNPSLSTNPENSSEPIARPNCMVTPSSSYCVSVASPTPLPPKPDVPSSPRGVNEIEGCRQWFRARLSCEAHIALARLSMARFFEFNPSVGSDCSRFVNGTWYCWSLVAEGEPSDEPSATTAPPATTTSGNGATTPTPTQSGMVAGCNRFYLVQPGDGCFDIANVHGISLDEFYAWNPAVRTDCSALQPDFHVCVGRSASPTSAPPAQPSPTETVSPNGICGGSDGWTCKDSAFGDCCSASGFCGSESDWCGSGCQPAFGDCDEDAQTISPNGVCGGAEGYTCAGSAFGNCCSGSGFCGSDTPWCGGGCQPAFGVCN